MWRFRCALHAVQFSRGNGRNLVQETSLVCQGTPVKNTEEWLPGLSFVPVRCYYKHQVEVNKRIQWKRPVKTPCILPEKSGDLSGLPEIDLSKPPASYEPCQALESANDYVKRVLSLQFQNRHLRREAKIAAVKQIVKRHEHDDNSVEVKIAKYTAIIRNLQIHCQSIPRDKKAKADLKEIIEFRKKRMKLLRTHDYRRFEWLLEKLDLLYKPAPVVHERVERKKSMLRLADDYIEKVKKKKLEEYKDLLESEKRGFLEKKLSTMKRINEEEKSIGAEPSFTEEEIAQVEETLKERILEEEKEAEKTKVVEEIY